ncbi:stage V sporulation protein AA [Pontibacillus halophilus JSM 076056 = DSM 19796]|uniref:Stage V sporulation protein AA n=1 Tax=Pontibacillus halophilus JSM 076056 = DSM 19796 TaxID=1385510 RepID=A0A0A5GM29_9BACI|nr:stage V sporulation protein AA [Pontibacillus halophilus]KGX92225.1 stage V sporulation protein AA [Pontibacillus halophilus JSM 076056 = DSM 19796]
MSHQPVYLRMNYKIEANAGSPIRLKDIAKLSGERKLVQELKEIQLHTVTKEDRSLVILDVFNVIVELQKRFPEADFQPLGPGQTIVVIKQAKKKPSILIVLVIWVLLFIGAAMAIMNFHFDVSMEAVHQRIYYLLTGEEVNHPLWIQIPYSIGLGIGMILFFNHLFKKRINEEPSPLEVELFKYEQDLDSYVTYYENPHNRRDPDDEGN